MENTYWFKQNNDPIFPELIWSRPENKNQAGKLLIVGGNSHGFAAPAEAYALAIKAGIGSCRVILPDHIRPQITKILGPLLEMDFAPSTPSGSFAANSLAEIIDLSNWSDAVLIAGDLGRNSETAIVLEKFVTKTDKITVITKDGGDHFTSNPKSILQKENICLVLSLAQLQKLFVSSKYHIAIKFSMDSLHLVEALRKFTTEHKITLVTKHLNIIYVARNGKVSTTSTNSNLEEHWRISVATKAAVWWLQNPSKAFEAITTSILQ